MRTKHLGIIAALGLGVAVSQKPEGRPEPEPEPEPTIDDGLPPLPESRQQRRAAERAARKRLR